MIDCHNHLLINVDDGAANQEEAIIMAKQAYESGVDALIVTPHSNQIGRFENYYDQSLITAWQELKLLIQQHDISLDMYLGMEIFAGDDIIEKIKAGKLIGLNQSRYYLIEFAFDEEIDYIEKISQQMLDNHFIPVLAHPERYHCFQREPWLIYRLLKKGCLTQVNKDSIFGLFGKNAQKTAIQFLDYQLVTLIASDSHDGTYRHGDMSDIRDYLEYRYDFAVSQQLLEIHPQAIIDNKKIIFDDQRVGSRYKSNI